MLKRPRHIKILIAILLLVFGIAAFLMFRPTHNQTLADKNHKLFAHEDSHNLQEKDYVSYQVSQLQYVTYDIQANNYADAQKYLNDILKNVPRDQLQTEVYVNLVAVEQHRGSLSKHKDYLVTLVTRLRQDHRTKEADNYQSLLSGLQ